MEDKVKINNLESLYPELAKEWDYKKNGNLTPQMVSKGSAKKVWWLCNKGHSYEASIYNRASGKGCPYCSGNKVLLGYNDLVTTKPELAKEWDYKKNGSLTPQMVSKGSNKKVWWLCNKGHSYESTISNRVKGKGCPYCSGVKVLLGYNDLVTTKPELAKEWDYEKNFPLRPDEVTEGCHKSVWWLCNKGHSYESIIYNRVKGRKCPYCSGRKVLDGYNDLATTKPELAKEWNYKKNGDLTPQMLTKGSGKKVWWTCNKGHSYESVLLSRTQGNDCPYCSGRKVLDNYTDLATTNPELAKEWDYKKNGNLTPQMVSKGSNKKVWWLCKEGHSYKTFVHIRTKGCDCPYCSGKKVLEGYNDLLTTNPELAKEWDYKKNGNLTPQMVSKGSAKKVWWLCKEGHNYEAAIRAKVKGEFCPYCSGKIVLEGYNDLATTKPEIAKEWDYEKNGDLTPQMVTKGSGKKVWWLCNKGHSYETTISHRVIGTKCSYCSGRKVLDGYNDLATTKPELAKEWDYKKNGDLTPQMVSSGMSKKVWWLCNKGHSYKSAICSRERCTNCPICSGHKVLLGYNDLETTKPELAKEWNYKKNGNLTPQMVTKGSGKKVWWTCNKGHSYESTISNRASGKGCPYCSGSKTERLVYEILTKNNIRFKAEKKFNDINVMYYPYDIYIASLRLIIEPDGIQHFQKVSDYFEDIPLEIRVKHDNIKNEFCTDNGYYGNARIPILRIPYIFSPDKEKDKIEKLVMDFIETRQVPKEILDFYKSYKESIGSNYYDIATKMNEIEKVS